MPVSAPVISPPVAASIPATAKEEVVKPVAAVAEKQPAAAPKRTDAKGPKDKEGSEINDFLGQKKEREEQRIKDQKPGANIQRLWNGIKETTGNIIENFNKPRPARVEHGEEVPDLSHE